MQTQRFMTSMKDGFMALAACHMLHLLDASGSVPQLVTFAYTCNGKCRRPEVIIWGQNQKYCLLAAKHK